MEDQEIRNINKRESKIAAVGAASGLAQNNDCCSGSAERPWNASHDEAKAAGFFNGEIHSFRRQALESMKFALHQLTLIREKTLSSRDESIAITYLEDSILRMECVMQIEGKKYAR